MNQQEFLKALQSELEKVGAQNTQEILSDYKEHFSAGLEAGKTEEEISAKLGQPALIAKAYEAERLISTAKTSSGKEQFMLALKVLGRLAVIAPLNFILLLVPGSIVFSLVVAGWTVLVALAAVCFAIFGIAIGGGVFALGAWFAVGAVSGMLASTGFVILAGMILFVITRFVILTLIKYLQWNVNFVLEK